MQKLKIPRNVRAALARRRDDERRERAVRMRAEIETDRAWAAEREKLRPLARVVLDWSIALGETGLVPEGGVRIRAETGSGRTAEGIIVRSIGTLALFRIYQPHGGEVRDVRTEDDVLRWPSDDVVVRDLAAAIESGEIWERVLRVITEERSA